MEEKGHDSLKPVCFFQDGLRMSGGGGLLKLRGVTFSGVPVACSEVCLPKATKK